MSGGVRHRADRHEAVAAAHLAPVGERGDDRVAVAHDGLGTRLVQDLHAVALEDLLDDGCRVGVFTRKHLVAARDERDLGTERAVRRRELGAGDAGTHDDEVLGHLLELVELGPREDALAVGDGGRQHPRARADRDDERVGLDAVEVGAALGGRDDDRVRSVEAPLALHEAHAGLEQVAAQVFGLLGGEPEESLVHRGEVDGDLGLDGLVARPLREELHAEIGGLLDRVRRLGGRDERLRRNHVGEHRGAADAGTFDERHLGSELRGRARGLVPAWSSSEDGNALRALELVGHAHILSVVDAPRQHPSTTVAAASAAP